ncbi:cysteine-rich receptor-like protein kinase 8 [Tanacetum coccineum]
MANNTRNQHNLQQNSQQPPQQPPHQPLPQPLEDDVTSPNHPLFLHPQDHPASSLWKELQEHYSQLDGHRIYQLTHDLVQLKQSNAAIEVYYHKLKGLWDEYDSLEAPYMCVCICECENRRVNGERDQRKRLI